MKKKQDTPSNEIKHVILGLFTLLFISGCSNQRKTPSENARISYTAPITISLDTCPSPTIMDSKNVERLDFSIIKSNDSTFSLRGKDNASKDFIADFIPPTIQKANPLKSFFTNFYPEDGIISGAQFCGFKDSGGNLWFGSIAGGVSRYNGQKFTNYTFAEGLQFGTVRGFAEDSNGNIWIGTDQGLSKFDGNSFRSHAGIDKLITGDLRSIAIDKQGILWVGTLGGRVFCFDLKNDAAEIIKLEIPSEFRAGIRCIIQDAKGLIWFGTHGRGAVRYDPSKESNEAFMVLNMDNGLSHNMVWTIQEDQFGKIWMGTLGGGVNCYDPYNNKKDGAPITTYTAADGLADNIVRSIFEDTSGNLWFGTNKGVSCLTRISIKDNNYKFRNYSTRHGLAENSIWAIIEDNGNNMWFSSYGGSISRYNGSSLSIYEHRSMGSGVRSIMEDSRGNLWYSAYNNGINRFDGSHNINYSFRPGEGALDALSMAEGSDGSLWFSSYSGALRIFNQNIEYDGSGDATLYHWQGLGTIAVITADRKSNIWMGARGREGGLIKYDGEIYTRFSSNQGLVHDIINCIEIDQSDHLWIGTSEGLSHFDGSFFTNYTKKNGLPHNKISCLALDENGNLWLGTEGGGISRFDGSGFMSFTTANGLSNDLVRSIKINRKGDLWIATNNGLCKLSFEDTGDNEDDRKEAGNLELSNDELLEYTPVWEIFNSSTGYPIWSMYDRVMVAAKVGLPKENPRDDKDVIWAGFGNEIMRFDPQAIHKSYDRPNVFIESIKIKDQTIPWYNLATWKIDSVIKTQQEVMMFNRPLLPADRDEIQNNYGDIRFDGIASFYPLPENLELPYRHNQVEFEYGAIETGTPEMVRYQYMLAGYSEDWSQVTNKTSATFGNIREGEYTFNVKAMSPDGVWSDPIQCAFRVLPPWWRSWWAYGFYGLCFVAGVFGVDRFQRRRLMEKERQKSREKELAQAKEIEKAYKELELSHNDLKSTQAQLIQSEKMASLGELTAGIAHEIQNPLNFVNNFSEVNSELIEELKEEAEKGNLEEVKAIAKDLLENESKIKHHGQRAEGIVKGMLMHSRTSQGEKEPTDINALADEYLRLAYHGMRVKDKSFNADFKTDFDESLPKINVVPQDIGRVLLNLINNAFYACAERLSAGEAGSLSTVNENNKTLRSAQSDEGYEYKPEVVVSTKLSPSGGGKGKEKIAISVRDNGPGIPEHIREKIFQPFFTTKPTGSGTGLGLSLSYDIVKAHGGEIKAESKENEGSVFIIKLPIA